jgi:Fe-S-cluster containining protein
MAAAVGAGLLMAQDGAHAPLNCGKCPGFCCRVAGYVEVSRKDIRRLAKFLGLTVRQFEERHLVEITRKREKLIKQDYETCQFLDSNRKCTVYKARPKDCREYVCWDQDDETVYEYASFFQYSIAKMRKLEKARR